MQLDFNDYVLVQSAVGLDSRTSIQIDESYLFAAPMDTVINSDNIQTFLDKKINVCLPRSQNDPKPNNQYFTSVSLSQFETLLNSGQDLNGKKILIDVANGNMPKLHRLIFDCKLQFPQSFLMAGNVASVHAFKELSNSGVDYIRCGIGAGSACLTAVHTAVSQGMATLILKCAKLKKKKSLTVKIVADGGFKTYRDIIMAFALGADYVMLGGIFSKCVEACSAKYYYNSNVNEYLPITDMLSQNVNYLFQSGKLYHQYRGMSTKAVQQDLGKEKLISSEGIIKYNKVEYTLDGWMENYYDYLKSAMSYVGAFDMEGFKYYSQVDKISPNAFLRFNK